MNETEAGQDQSAQPGQAPPPSPGQPPPPWSEYVDRGREFAKEHPAAAVAIAVGAGALVAAQFTVGALVGLGAAMVIGRKIGPEKRDEVLRQGEELLTRTRAQGQRAFEEGKSRAEQLLKQGQRLWPFGRGDQGGDDGSTKH